MGVFDPTVLFPHFRYFDKVVAVSPGQTIEVLTPNANRVFAFLRSATTSATLRIGGPAKLGTGMQFTTTAPLQFSISDSGVIPMLSFSVFEQTTLNGVYIMEVWYVP
jgi:hypothetical protein